MNVKNVKIRFNLDKKNDRSAYDYLQNAGQSYSKAVISAVCGYMELSKARASEDAFLERVITTIREETSKINPLAGLVQLVQTPPAQEPAEQETSAETEEAMLDFLDSF